MQLLLFGTIEVLFAVFVLICPNYIKRYKRNININRILDFCEFCGIEKYKFVIYVNELFAMIYGIPVWESE